MSYLLDTDICSAHMKQRGPVTGRMMQYTGRLRISAVTLGELETWVSRANAPASRRVALDEFLREVEVLPVSEEIARRFGRLRAELLDAGRPSPELDLLIAATALEHGLTLVTHNTADYANVPGIDLEDWLIGS